MKRTLLNLGAILVAFIIGLAINNACADSLENMSDTELRKLVAQLQQEVNSLKSRVAELEGCNKQIYFRHFFAKLFRHFSRCFCDSSVLVYT